MATVLPLPTPEFLSGGGRWFDETGVASVPAGALQFPLVTVPVTPAQVAIVIGVGVDAGQLTNWYWCRFELQVNGSPDPTFNDIRGMVARLLEPVQLYRVARPSTQVVGMVSNINGTVPFQFAFRVFGYTFSADTEFGRKLINLRAG
ncbi:MAG TPA: hypothetical protein PKI22_08770 [Hydrogenophilus thermoluteolus]|nr:hypothetical protein [Hydrogenophilus thermoluteolus]